MFPVKKVKRPTQREAGDYELIIDAAMDLCFFFLFRREWSNFAYNFDFG